MVFNKQGVLGCENGGFESRVMGGGQSFSLEEEENIYDKMYPRSLIKI